MKIWKSKLTVASNVDASFAAINAYCLFDNWFRKSAKRFGTLWDGSSLGDSGGCNVRLSSVSSKLSSDGIGVDQPSNCSFKSTSHKRKTKSKKLYEIFNYTIL
jgi:hypothetical protein